MSAEWPGMVYAHLVRVRLRLRLRVRVRVRWPGMVYAHLAAEGVGGGEGEGGCATCERRAWACASE